MEKLKLNANYLLILTCLVILVLAGSYGVYTTYFPPEDLNPEVPGSTQDPGSQCNPQDAAPRVLVPVDTSVPIQDPMPGIRYSLNTSDSGRTIVLGKGDIIEINLKFAPGLAMRWTVPVSGCGLELVNDGIYSKGGDFWNVTDYYRARYRAVSPGTSVLNGRLVITDHAEKGDLWFNLTVIVK
jgi:hypothetical protein